MSYKAKSTRRRSRSVKPYERNNNLVDKVKSWLAPSSWLSYLTPSKNGQSSDSRNGPLSFQDSSCTPTVQRLHSDRTSQAERPLNQHCRNDVLASTSSNSSSPGTRMSTANYRAALSLFEEALGNNDSSTNPANHLTDSSNESFVEEETEPEATTHIPPSISGMDVQTDGRSTEQIFASDENQSTSVTRAHSPAHVEGTRVQEHTVQMVSNPAFVDKVTPLHQRTVMVSPRVNKGLSAELTRRLYSPTPIHTSSLQLSPVHERSEESTMDAVRGSSPFQALLASHECISGLVTPSRAITNESISRSPFRSPFYSGRTSFGGAASQQKLRVKRPRTESSPPVIAPLRVSVKATPTGSTGPSVMSAAAKRIMNTLNSLASPLSDARRIPLRGAPPDMQAKRRCVSEGPSSVISPPPITPLHSIRPHPSSSTQTVFSKQSPSPTSMGNNLSKEIPEMVSSYMTTTTTSIFAPKVLNSHPLIASSSPSVLAGLKFSAPPILPTTHSHSPSHTSPLAHSPRTTPRMKSRHAGGKMTRPLRSGRKRVTLEEDSEEEKEYRNPVALPPHVELSLGQGGALPSFTFSSQLYADKTDGYKSSAFAQPLLSTTNCDSLSSFPGFSFASPTPVSVQSVQPANTPPNISFGFSVPKPCLPTSQLSSISTLTATLTTKTAISFDKKSPTKSPPPLLKNKSVVDALKKTEYSQFLPSNITKNCIDLTSTNDETSRKGTSDSRPLPQFDTPIGSWECKQCLVNNKPIDDKCVACTAAKPDTDVLQLGSTAANAPFPKLLPTTGSWECNVCLINNKLSDNKCAACGTAKPIVGSNNKSSNKSAEQFSALVSSSIDWACDTCLVPNKQGAIKCVACSASKPGALTGSKNTPSGSGDSSSSGFKLGGVSLAGLGQGLKLGGSLLSGTMTPTSGGFKLGSGITLGKKNFESAPISNDKPLENTFSSVAKPGGGLSLGGETSNVSMPIKDSWSCETCMVVNKDEAGSCIACSASKPNSNKPKPAAGGLNLGRVSLNVLVKDQDSNKSPQWTCDTCLVENKSDVTACVACTAPRPGPKSEKKTKKEDNQSKGFTSGLQIGSTGNFKFGDGLSSRSSLVATTLLQETATTSSLTNSTIKPTLQLGVSMATSVNSGLNIFPGNLSTAGKPHSGLKFGVQSTGISPSTGNFLCGIKLGENALITSGSFGLSGSTTNPSLTLSAASSNSLVGGTTNAITNSPLTCIKLGSLTSSAPVTFATTNAITNSPLTGIKLSSLTSSAPVTLASTKASPLTSITLGGSNLRSEIKFGENLSSSFTSASPLKFGQSLMTSSTSSNLLTGIKMGSVAATAGTLSDSPLAGIKIGGTVQATSTSTSALHTLPKLPSNFSFGNTSTNSLQSINFTGGQKLLTPGIQFGGASGSMLSTSSKPNTPSFTFGSQTQSFAMATPAGNSNHAEMQSPDSEMTVDSGQTQGASLAFRAPQQAIGTNLFSGLPKSLQNPSGFTFSASVNPTTSSTFGGNLPKAPFNFNSTNVSSSSTLPNPSFAFSGTPKTTEPLLTNTGFQFNVNPRINTNFGSVPQLPQTQSNMFSATGSGASTPGGRLIKKARRRKQ